MESSPFFSVVIPTFRRPKLLRETLESVVAQTFADFEVLVVDDGPSDENREVVARFGDARLRYLVNARGKGGAGTRNTGVFCARGTWIAFLDDDDLWEPRKLERQHALIMGVSEAVALVYTGHTSFSAETGEELGVFVPQHAGRLHATLLNRNVIKGFYSVAVRRDILLALDGLDERFPALQDLELYVRVARQHEVAFVAEPLVRVRVGARDRITTNYHNKLLGSRLFWEKYREDISKSPLLTVRAATRVAQFAFVTGDYLTFARLMPQLLLGLFYDGKSVLGALRFMAAVSRQRWRGGVPS
jgi:glycosyltransferase involved in cell wall biosynthesis